MSSSRAGDAVRRAAAVLLVLAAIPFAHAEQVPSSSGFRDVNLAEYRQHLERLDGVVQDCAAQIEAKKPPANEDACAPDLVGPDDRVQGVAGAGSAAREVRYDWLRSALRSAGKKASGAAPNLLGKQARIQGNSPDDAAALLRDARRRIEIDAQQIAPQISGPRLEKPAYAEQRKSIDGILSQREYKNAKKETARDRIREWFANLLEQIFMRLAGMGARAQWIGRLLEFLLPACALTGLIWILIRLERNARVRLVPDSEPARGTPSAREWQLWLKDAQNAAAAGAWRDAIHSVYWASIARLESGRLWPADRARTPREYLALLGGTDPRRNTLTALTRSFERTRYGGREAAAADFDAALHLAAELGVEAK